MNERSINYLFAQAKQVMPGLDIEVREGPRFLLTLDGKTVLYQGAETPGYEAKIEAFLIGIYTVGYYRSTLPWYKKLFS